MSDTDERRYSTATKMVFGREELDRYGDTTLGDVLKRLPGITISGAPGRGGDIRMRGLGRGYTLILINGEPAPRGFSLDSLSPDQVERIEIMRAPVAENSARAIAGTINIILREELAKRENEARLSLGWEEGRGQPNLSLQRNDVIDKLSYNISANVSHREIPRETLTSTSAFDTTTGAPTLLQELHDTSRTRSDSLHLNARLNWRLEGGDGFTLIPFVTTNRSESAGHTTLDQPIGALPPTYATQDWYSTSDSTIARAFGNWRLRWRDGSKLELKFNGGVAESDSQIDRNQYAASGAVAHVLRGTTGIRDASFSQSGKYSKPIGGGHQFGAGWEAEGGTRRESASNVQDGVDPLAQYGDIQAKTKRFALYAQDEWDVTKLWAMYGGLRWETIRTTSSSALDSTGNRSSVLSPLFHTVWRFDPESKDQLRFAVTRTYRSPTLGNLVSVPSLSSLYPATGPNTPTNADTVGNPDLKPELALGVDIALEHYFEAGGLLSASVFRRSIDNLIRNVTLLETVSWSPVQRWVSRPRNIGHAMSQGVELEAKFRLTELYPEAPKIDVRANYSRYWSTVDGIPGPYNRLDQQPTWTANFGSDYRFTVVPLTIGGNLNLTPSFIIQQAVGQQYVQGRKRVADVYALWKFDSSIQLRVSASNLFGADYLTGSREVFGNTDQTASTAQKTYRYYAARFELKF